MGRELQGALEWAAGVEGANTSGNWKLAFLGASYLPALLCSLGSSLPRPAAPGACLHLPRRRRNPLRAYPRVRVAEHSCLVEGHV